MSQHGRRVGSVALLGLVGALWVLPFATNAGASPPSKTTSSTTTTTTSPPPPPRTVPYKVFWMGIPPQKDAYNRANSGMSNATNRVFNADGQLAIYGNPFVTYELPFNLQSTYKSPAGLFALGEQLYASNCAQCHGVTANGVPSTVGANGGGFPDLQLVGPATIDFWIESGRMPAVSTKVTQAIRRPARLHHLQALAIASWITAQWPRTPYIPHVNLKGANLSDGFQLFAENCAACHTITGDGDALANSTYSPSLRDIPATQVAEALRTGPANMPVFTGNMTDQQLRDVVAYVVQKIQHPENPGGVGLGGLGPVGEGFVGLALGVGLLALIGFWVGDRS